jgi:hypothetical protein
VDAFGGRAETPGKPRTDTLPVLLPLNKGRGTAVLGRNHALRIWDNVIWARQSLSLDLQESSLATLNEGEA